MSECRLCPRECGADREHGTGYCSAYANPNIARADLHFWEEPCISGTRGSGAVFFCGCNLNCVFCQNHAINHTLVGGKADYKALAGLMLQLQAAGAHNINLVTPAPHVDTIIDAVNRARDAGLLIPIVYNTNAYEKTAALSRLKGIVDIYLPDLKYVDCAISARYSGASDYFAYASEAVLEMRRQVGDLALDSEGMAVKGLLIRHLVLPGSVDETRRVLDFIAEELSPCTPERTGTYISLMGQYAPAHKASAAPLNRKLTRGEYERAIEYCISLGFEHVFIQSLQSADLIFRPDFDGWR